MEAATRRPRHGRSNNRGRCKKNAGKRQAATLEQQRLTAREGLVEAATKDWMVLGVLKVFKGLKAGKRQANKKV